MSFLNAPYEPERIHENWRIGLDRDNIIELLSQSAAMIREDLALLAMGTIRLSVFGADVTHDHCGRLQSILDRLERVIEHCRAG